jgi:uncharacterized membrane protein YfcA
MPEALQSALHTPGLIWMVLAISAAGLVRGFTGFGTALIFVPVAGQFLPPADVILLMACTGIASTMAILPKAWGTADRREVGALVLAAVVTIPIGIWIMSFLDGLTVRWIVVAVASTTLVAVIAGWRWHGDLKAGGRIFIGGAAGLVGGMTGLTGPLVIMFYLANARSALAVRSNTILFLAALDVLLVLNLILGGFSNIQMVWTAAILAIPYVTTTLIGQALFDPSKERVYRLVAYTVIGLAVVSGIPLFD